MDWADARLYDSRGSPFRIESMGTQKPKAKKAKATLPARRENSRTGVYRRSKNALAIRHVKTQYMVRRMKMVMPWLLPSDMPALRAFCELEYFCAAISNALDKGKSLFDPDGNVRRLGHDYRIFRQSQMAYMRELGMTPVAHAMLKASSAGEPLGLAAQFALDDARERAALKRAKPAKAEEGGD